MHLGGHGSAHNNTPDRLPLHRTLSRRDRDKGAKETKLRLALISQIILIREYSALPERATANT